MGYLASSSIANILLSIRPISLQYIRPLEPLSVLSLRTESVVGCYCVAVNYRIYSILSVTALWVQ